MDGVLSAKRSVSCPRESEPPLGTIETPLIYPHGEYVSLDGARKKHLGFGVSHGESPFAS